MPHIVLTAECRWGPLLIPQTRQRLKPPHIGPDMSGWCSLTPTKGFNLGLLPSHTHTHIRHRFWWHLHEKKGISCTAPAMSEANKTWPNPIQNLSLTLGQPPRKTPSGDICKPGGYSPQACWKPPFVPFVCFGRSAVTIPSELA